jgi:ABC-type transport system substrate-binding protein
MKQKIKSAVSLFLATVLVTGCGGGTTQPGEKVLRIGAVAVAGSSDPNNLDSMYDLDLANLVYDTLYEYEYLARPFKLKPAMAESVPKVSKDGLTYTIKLKKGIEYIDDACFPGGQGREAVMKDFVTNLMRKADIKTRSSNWWLIDGLIVGLNELREKYKEKPMNYDEEVAGLKLIDDHTLELKLTKPFPQVMWILAMAGMALYPIECARHYGDNFANHPVGTGPFKMESWSKNTKYVVVRNEKYRDDVYPSEGTDADRKAGRLEDAGKKLPFADRVIVKEFTQSMPYWLEFRAGKLAWGRVPGEFTEEVFKIKSKTENSRVWELDAENNRVTTEDYSQFDYYPLPLLDFIYRGFNYEDKYLGGEKGKKLRQAISMAHDTREENDLYYNGLNKVYAGIIPPGVGGFEEGKKNPYEGPNIEKARKLLAEAGYPEGKGLPPIQLCGDENVRTQEQAARFLKNAERIGVKINYEAMRFAELSKKLRNRQCQMMGLAWGGDWPDAQNFIQLMYGPNKSPGSNNMNFDHPEVNRLYEKTITMPDGPIRNKIYQQINDIVLESVPFIGSMARTRDYLIPKETKNFKPEEMIHSHGKFVRMTNWKN